jgi:hypothetical protein
MTDRNVSVHLDQILMVDGEVKKVISPTVPENPQIYDFCLVSKDAWNGPASPGFEPTQTGTKQVMQVFNGAAWVEIVPTLQVVTFHD